MSANQSINALMSERTQLEKDIKAYDKVMKDYKDVLTDMVGAEQKGDAEEYDKAFNALSEMYFELSDHIAMIRNTCNSMEDAAGKIQDYYRANQMD